MLYRLQSYIIISIAQQIIEEFVEATCFRIVSISIAQLSAGISHLHRFPINSLSYNAISEAYTYLLLMRLFLIIKP